MVPMKQRQSCACARRRLHALLVLMVTVPTSCPAQEDAGHIHLLQHGVLHRLQGGYVLYLGPPWAVGGHFASPWSSPQAAGESLLRCWSLRIHVAKVSRSGVAVSQWAAESALVVSPWCRSGVQKGPQGGGSCTLEECP
ncbi:hypothetical protein QYF61_016269 [Mycteria americana]|uniref:Uncharacterized protein n=1 Tax=Mycteria americana TaxID=33587 RepID=A0AAN7RH13_MYCAM|nr:hypothetical protein QYF61_016269 [Mycteria americana]